MKHKRLFGCIVAGLGVFVWLAAPVQAAQEVSQSYRADASIQSGVLVQLSKKDPEKVEPLTKDVAIALLGVTIPSNDTPVVFKSGGTEREVFVGFLGRYDVLVSNENGTIVPGDFVAISSLAGVGMKADSRQKTIVGTALESFPAQSADSSITLKDSAGKQTEVSVGRIAVDVNIGINPLYEAARTEGVPEFLAKAVQIVTKEPRSAMRIYASVMVLFVVTIGSAAVLYVGLRSGMRALGRNPLARGSIIKGMIQVGIVAAIIFILGLIAVYLILRL